MSATRKACPFCGTVPPADEWPVHPLGGLPSVGCPRCGAFGPDVKGDPHRATLMSDADRAWNGVINFRPTETNAEGLRPCPFCGAEAGFSYLNVDGPDDVDLVGVHCHGCGAVGPARDCGARGALSAAAAWNALSPALSLADALAAGAAQRRTAEAERAMVESYTRWLCPG